MSQILIVGIGNPLRSDDRVGWQLAMELSRETHREDLHIIAAHQLTPEMSETASHAERVLFIDASASAEPGTVKCELIAPGTTASGHAHELTPAGLLQLAQDLYARCPAAYLLTIGAESFNTGESLSATVTAALPQAKAEIARFLAGMD